MAAKTQSAFFKTVFQGDVEFDAERFLVEVEAQFPSEDIREEVRWRLDVLKEVANLPELVEGTAGLKHRLSEVFSAGGDEKAVLDKLKRLTEIQGANGEMLDLRRFLKRGRRSYTEAEYRVILAKKLDNTGQHIANLEAFYPDAADELNKLGQVLEALRKRLHSATIPVSEIKAQEDKLRETTTFRMYEDLKIRFLRDWIARFTALSPAEIAGKTTEEVQKLILEHQRHQISQLVKQKVVLCDMDMSEHLGLHDTLECEFRETGFWKDASEAVRQAFRHWILGAVQAFGMLKGMRYACFQSQTDKDQFLLFGLGVSALPQAGGKPLMMVPYMKPFTRKANYLLEVRKRDMGDAQAYYHELVHYVLPFLYAFDQMKEFKIGKDLLIFFNTRYSS